MQDLREIYKTLNSWNKGSKRLSHRVLLEMPRLKTRWGVFVLLLSISDLKTGWVKISIKDLVTLTGAVRKNIYTILKAMDKNGYIRYIPAKNGRRRHISIQILGMDKYIVNRKNRVLSIDKNTEELLDAQRDLLMHNPGYRKEMLETIRGLFREKIRAEVPEDIIYGKTNSLLERFMADDLVRSLKGIGWEETNCENPVGYLIMSLENGNNGSRSKRECLGVRA